MIDADSVHTNRSRGHLQVGQSVVIQFAPALLDCVQTSVNKPYQGAKQSRVLFNLTKNASVSTSHEKVDIPL